ncbi:MAG TPA: sugar ABC transporter substrate-binding protein [Candidatus Hydrogenedentes bacterium]|nr:sugar ABC transporter substrate-binding protein [Candidatus Hydrogenedentota bacterium]
MWRWMSRACLLLAAGLAVGCGAQPAGEGAAEKGAEGPAKPRIALIMKSLANEFFKTMEEGARGHHAAHEDDYVLLAEGIKNETDVNRQVRLVEQMMAQNVDGIVIAPADSKALVSVCKKAMDAGIVVVNIDNKFDEAVLEDAGVHIPFVGPNNRAGAKKVGDYLAQHLETGAPVAIIEGVPTAFNAIQRKQGFEDAMKEAGLKVVASQSADWHTDKANKVVAALIADHPELKALLCANDNMALGAVAALRTAGKLDEIKVVGFDNINAVQELVKRGDIVATADQHADQLAVFGIEYALDMLGGKGTPEDRETPVDLITAESL